MSLEEFDQDNKAVSGFKGSMDLVMGVIYLTVSGYCYFRQESIEQFRMINPNIFVILFASYGIFRMYRGWRKMKGALKR